MINSAVAQVDLAKLAHKAGPVGLVWLGPNPPARSDRGPDRPGPSLSPSSSSAHPLSLPTIPHVTSTATCRLRRVPAIPAAAVGHRGTGVRGSINATTWIRPTLPRVAAPNPPATRVLPNAGAILRCCSGTAPVGRRSCWCGAHHSKLDAGRMVLQTQPRRHLSPLLHGSPVSFLYSLPSHSVYVRCMYLVLLLGILYLLIGGTIEGSTLILK
jgi:hypothetical protein